MAASRQNGQFIETSYFDNTGGLNISDSVFKVKDTQSTGGANFEYAQTGGVTKRRGSAAINTVADADLLSRGIEIYNTTLGVKTVMRAAGRHIQAVDIDALTFTNLSQDVTTTTTTVFPVSTSVTTVFAQFNTVIRSMLNFAGGTDGVYTAYSPSNYTKNGAVAATGTMSTTVLTTGGAFTTSGNFQYAVTYTKTATGAESNAALDVIAAVTTTTGSVLVSFNAITSVDTATYNAIKLYRSAVSGLSGFTTGDLVATLTLPIASYTDTGSASLVTQLVPRAGSTVSDCSVLPSGTYNVIATWKRRLVTARGSTLYYSDINIPESWPTLNKITIPSGGPITALAVISFNTDYGNDEYLAVFKERELWLVKGNSYTDVTLSFVDTVGCAAQSLVTFANGFLAWVDYRGVYLWDGSGKPIYTSQPIENYFTIDGELDKTQLIYGWGSYFRNRNMIYWFLSSKTYGTQALVIKMDLRLTLPMISSNLTGRVIQGVFVVDTNSATPVYAAKTYLPSTSVDEIMLVGDTAGFVYKAYQQFSDNGTGIDFQYYTPFLFLDSPNTAKRFRKVIAWVDAVGTWDLKLDYWAGYRAAIPQKSTLQQPMTSVAQNATALWDVAYWNQSYWDDYTLALTGVVFNLNNTDGNSEGDCIRLNFRNNGIDQPVTIYGYTVVWSDMAMSK
jgi:hypothetical protein